MANETTDNGVDVNASPENDNALAGKVATGEQPVDVSSDKPPVEASIDALAFADKIYPMVAGMMFDPLCAMVGTSFNSSTPIKSVPCAFVVIRQNGADVPKLVERHPLKVVLYTIAKLFPGITRLSDSAAMEKVISILFALQAIAVLYQGIVAGMPTGEQAATAVTTPEASKVYPVAPKPSKRKAKVVE